MMKIVESGPTCGVNRLTPTDEWLVDCKPTDKSLVGRLRAYDPETREARIEVPYGGREFMVPKGGWSFLPAWPTRG